MCVFLDIMILGGNMKKVVLVDGNNLLFRSYYATAYTGTIMRNSKGFPTNALYGFAGMINKIINEENPEYMVVAFDIGKNFRKEKFDFYKEGRSETPDDLRMQMPLAREILKAMGIAYREMAPYEADDIIGTIAKVAEQNEDYYSLIVSSDKDLLQLISFETEIKLLKQSGFIRFNEESFKEEYGIDPIRIIDLKSLMGDASDNIPGVKGIGEKTALKLLQEYGSLDGIYENIDNIKGKMQEKLLADKENAYMSYELATIFRDVPIDINFEDFKYDGPNTMDLKKLYEELEFFSMLKNMPVKKEDNKENTFIKVTDLNEITLDNEVAFYLEVSDINYHKGKALALSITDKENTYCVPKHLIQDAFKLLEDKKVITYDLKKSLVIAKTKINCDFDLMVGAYLIDLPATEDIFALINACGEKCLTYEALKRKNFEGIDEEVSLKSKFIFEYSEKIKEKVKEEEQEEILNRIEMPLIYVLADMEIYGFKFESKALYEMKEEVVKKIDTITHEIYDLSGTKFNVASPKQLGEVLFEKMEIGKSKKINRGYKTDIKTLQKYEDRHPIIGKVLEYRNLSKLLSTYLEGLQDYVLEDGKIHTIFNQTLTRTGRLSSMEPNLQNIPAREEYGRKVRLAFVPSNDLILSADYSQIELRILAHISESRELIEAFVNDEDIHTKVAADIHGIDESEVTKHMRSMAKAVIFGIVYGISGFGLGENLNISRAEASKFIEKYYELYPGVKNYMINIVKEAYATGEVKTMFGRKRKINELKDTNFRIRAMGERMALNTPIQGSSADIMKMAMLEVYKKMKGNNLESKLILQVHDEIIIDAKENELEKLKVIIKEAMENVVSISVPLKIEINTGHNWYEAK
ncbi:MAG: DNA polymerase I [Firmicutes bacterium]|nr:DNA polymerase I [Bacillota bacterium]